MSDKQAIRSVETSTWKATATLDSIEDGNRVHADIGQQLDELGYTGDEKHGVWIALEEAIANGFKHGNQMVSGKKVEVSYTVTADGVFVRIVDEGDGFDPADVSDPLADENLERPSGRGLFLMRHYMNFVHVDPATKSVTMQKQRGVLTAGQLEAAARKEKKVNYCVDETSVKIDDRLKQVLQ
ncbi:MAG: ATP-binding protein [Candidatus Peribacteraceae bacterium]|nr:ATP-binding protein [Candidatus Peribacteraceae bacterium]